MSDPFNNMPSHETDDRVERTKVTEGRQIQTIEKALIPRSFRITGSPWGIELETVFCKKPVSGYYDDHSTRLETLLGFDKSCTIVFHLAHKLAHEKCLAKTYCSIRKSPMNKVERFIVLS